ncbi:cupin domain-containing protein [Chitinophaga niabensis]|uniref:Mannose-6-phosphate isomerase, cupin superfamily n=1 Tax=Chitinophaga niabensis TaxID=536979 RepID=A0A1N6IX66_9BACT|nr:cupin domain-containing protein [Chitinophaga niabensis]SIO36577.1 Mannose-6-phosphate isomerase, cupin superfamily [Chitinophaga niabensis]
MKKTIINPVIKDEITFTQTAAETNGRISTLVVKLMPGGGTPMHYHKNFSETFVVTEGELTLYLKNMVVKLLPGQKFIIEKGQAHRFANEFGAPVVFTTIVQPGFSGFENALCILYGLARDKRTNGKGIPLSLLDLAVVTRMSDMHQPGALALLSPLLIFFNILARIGKVDKKLIAKYCLNAE